MAFNTIHIHNCKLPLLNYVYFYISGIFGVPKNNVTQIQTRLTKIPPAMFNSTKRLYASQCSSCSGGSNGCSTQWSVYPSSGWVCTNNVQYGSAYFYGTIVSTDGGTFDVRIGSASEKEYYTSTQQNGVTCAQIDKSLNAGTSGAQLCVKCKNYYYVCPLNLNFYYSPYAYCDSGSLGDSNNCGYCGTKCSSGLKCNNG